MSAASTRLLLPALCAAAMLGSIGFDLTAPCLPSMRRAFRASMAEIQLTMASYAASFSLGTLAGGFLADGVGAGLVLLFGIGVFSAASMLLVGANQLFYVVAVRATQGGAIGMASVCTQVIAAACYPAPSAFARASGRLQVVRQVAAALAPAVGAYLEDMYGWRSTSVGMVLVGLLSLALCSCARLGTSHRLSAAARPVEDASGAQRMKPDVADARSASHALRAACGHMSALLGSALYIGLVCAEAASFSAQNLIFVTAPHLLRGTATGLTTGEFGLAYALMVIASVTASEAFHWFVRVGSSPRAMGLRGAAAQLCGAAALGFAACFSAHASPWLAIIAPTGVICAGRGLVAVHTTTAVADAVPPGLKGTAIGLMFCARNLSLSAVIMLTGATYTKAPLDDTRAMTGSVGEASSVAEPLPMWPLALATAALEIGSMAGLALTVVYPAPAASAAGVEDAADGDGEARVAGIATDDVFHDAPESHTAGGGNAGRSTGSPPLQLHWVQLCSSGERLAGYYNYYHELDDDVHVDL